MDAATDVNGGNADVTRDESNLETSAATPELSDTTSTPDVTFKMESQDVQEVNGDVKDSPKKAGSPLIRRKLRKFKANSNTSIMENSDSTPKTRGRKRKISEFDDTSEESTEFNGFDTQGLELETCGSQVLKKLIAEAEYAEAVLAKRPRFFSKKGFDDTESDDNKTHSLGLDRIKKEKESDKSETESIGIPNSVESEVDSIKQDAVSPKSLLLSSSVTSSPSWVSTKSKTSRISRGASPGSTPKAKSIVDMSNPAFKEPFKYGWKRELVFRASNDSSLKRMADIYYYTPKGKKVRSFREVAECLNSKVLTIDNFTFFKEPLGMNDPEKEIIRDAKRSRASMGSHAPSKKLIAAKKAISSRKSGVETSPVSAPATPMQTASAPSTLKSFTKTSKGTPGFKAKTPAKKTPQIKIKTEEIEMLPPQRLATTRRSQQAVEKLTPPKTKRLLTPKVQEPCSIRCSTSMGLIPSLQCHVCLCLYHPECIIDKEYTAGDNYICKNCQQDSEESETMDSSLTPPPLIPISIMGAQISKTKRQGTHLVTPPKLQRLPKSDNQVDPQSQNSTKHSKVTSETPSSPVTRDKKEDSWFSQVENEFLQSHDGTLPKPAQNIALMGGKRYIVVPKNNAMAVQPAITVKPDKIGDKPPMLQEGSVSVVPNTSNSLNSAFTSITNVVSHPRDLEVFENDKDILKETSALESDSPREVHLEDQQKSPVKADDEFPMEISPIEKVPDNEIKLSNTEVKSITCNQFSNVVAIENSNVAFTDTPETINLNLVSCITTQKKQNQQEIEQQQHFMDSVCAGYHALLRIFQYLKVQELLRAARVCKMWRDLAAHPSLWKTVRMKNSQVTDWDGLADTLQRRGTQHLDLRKMLVAGESDGIWKKFLNVIPRVTSLLKLELCRCPVMVVEEVLKSCPQLQVMSAMSIKCESLSLESVGNLKECQELRLKAISGMSLTGDLLALQELSLLTQLSLTSVKELGKKKIEIIQHLTNIETLELGECSDFPDKFGTLVLIKLKKLERLRLEKGQGLCCTFDILDGVSKLPNLCQMELVNFDVKNGFDKCLANCKNIKRLLIIPTYISQSATSNNMVLGGVTELSNNLTHFVWGVTLELLRVTELFVDQCNLMNKQVTGDSIPVLKPVPCLKLIEDVEDENENQKGEDKPPNLTSPQVDILPLPQLQKLLLTALPKTRVKILKIPFHATWRQSISDTTTQ